MRLPRVTRIFSVTLTFLLQVSISCHAQSLQAPTDNVLLSVSGAIIASPHQPGSEEQQDKDQTIARFDRSMLEATGLIKVTTETPWTTGLVEFEGPLMRDILERVGATGTLVQATALDNYIVEIPIDDFLRYDVILATRKNGKPIPVRENGPLWIIYPWTELSDLRRPEYYSRSIWQLESLTVLP